PAGQVSPTGTGAPPAQSTTPAPATGGVSGAASSSVAQPAENEGSSSGVAAVTDSDLESQIQNALNKEPTLTGDSTHVKVSGDTIEVGGNVNTNKEKVTATRIVQSYAGSRKVVNHLAVGKGSGNTTSPRSEPQDQTDRTGSGTTNPATNPEPNKGGRPPLN
ncbi:MAG TPA: BON domain-containing protein, partial [Candidatus Sulfotelmatobacter sp.]|nr:BON domain-containing protein [Candidatus Sulfotelmatobacter sp.]